MTQSPLSIREKKVIMSLSSGNQNKEIAHELNISINTVKKHLKNIFRKMEVDGRNKAVKKFFYSGGLLDSKD